MGPIGSTQSSTDERMKEKMMMMMIIMMMMVMMELLKLATVLYGNPSPVFSGKVNNGEAQPSGFAFPKQHHCELL